MLAAGAVTATWAAVVTNLRRDFIPVSVISILLSSAMVLLPHKTRRAFPMKDVVCPMRSTIHANQLLLMFQRPTNSSETACKIRLQCHVHLAVCKRASRAPKYLF